jgi:hypothetical protein
MASYPLKAHQDTARHSYYYVCAPFARNTGSLEKEEVWKLAINMHLKVCEKGARKVNPDVVGLTGHPIVTGSIDLPGTVVYIVAHGTSSIIGTKYGEVRLNGAALAELLHNSFPNAVPGHVKIMSCNSGSDVQEGGAELVYANPTTARPFAPFAMDVCKAAIGKNNAWKDCSFYGYIGFTEDVRKGGQWHSYAKDSTATQPRKVFFASQSRVQIKNSEIVFCPEIGSDLQIFDLPLPAPKKPKPGPAMKKPAAAGGNPFDALTGLDD